MVVFYDTFAQFGASRRRRKVLSLLAIKTQGTGRSGEGRGYYVTPDLSYDYCCMGDREKEEGRQQMGWEKNNETQKCEVSSFKLVLIGRIARAQLHTYRGAWND